MKWSDKEIEMVLVSIWKKLLGIDDVRSSDNFFQLGGDSVLALRLISAVGKELGIDLSFKMLYRWPTLGRLSQSIGSVINQTADSAEKESIPDAERQITKAIGIEYNGERYYKILPAQRYWVDDEIDQEYKKIEKTHGVMTMDYDIIGLFRVDCLMLAIAYLVRRHESLRSTFHKLGDQYFLKVEKGDSPDFVPVYKDFSCHATADAKAINSFVLFEDHKFDLQKGPLFLVRVCKTGEDNHMLSIKLHHSIYDGWSINVMLRDLLVAYEAFTRGQQPDIPDLKYQYKDYLAVEGRHAETNYTAHRKYWTDKYLSLPPEILLPGASRSASDMSEKFLKMVTIPFPKNIFDKLNRLAKEYSVGMFVLLQATIKSYLYHTTGEPDLVVGTHTFGRDYMDSENQIGGYATTVVLRTIFDPEDSFSECLDKVKKSNDDMHQYSAFTLLNRLEEMLDPGEKVYGKFWRINLEYPNPDKGFTGMGDGEDVLQRLNLRLGEGYARQEVEMVATIDVLMTFLKNGDNMDISLSYDTSLFQPSGINAFIEDYFTHVQNIPERIPALSSL